MQLVHMSGAGNRFLVGESPEHPVDVPQLIAKHPRPDGMPVEGVLLIHRPTHQLAIDYYNPDGSSGMMCGNGTRCAVRWAADHFHLPANKPLAITVNDHPYEARMIANGIVEVLLPAPTSIIDYPVGTLTNVTIPATYVMVNSDHVVVEGMLDSSDGLIGVLRHHPQFPRGANVNMATVLDPSHVRLATFERGVEAITGACGTGAVSTAVALWHSGRLTDHVTVIPPSGRELQVAIDHDEHITAVPLTGDALYDFPPSSI